MKVRFQADADLNRAIVTGLKRRQPEIEFASAAEGGLLDLPDEEALAASARHGRILVTHDKRTMPHHFGRFIETDESPGVLIVIQNRSVADAIDELILIWMATDADEWFNRIAVLPI